MSKFIRFLEIIDIIFFIQTIIHAMAFLICWWINPDVENKYVVVFILFYISFKIFLSSLQRKEERTEYKTILNQLINNIEHKES